MDTRKITAARRHARGAVRPLVIAIIAIIALLAVGAWFLIIKPHQDLVMEDSGGHPSTPVSASERSTPPPADVAGMDINQLLGEARKAINEQRYLAPAGNNAFEFYLRVLVKQPGNQVAADALRETFPFAATSAEQAVNSRDFNEAQRQIDLLAKADPANFTLTILRSKLDAQRKLLDKQQQQVVDEQKAQQLAAQKAATEKQAADQALVDQQKAKLVEQQRTQQAKAAAPTPAPTAATQAAPTETQAAATGGQSSDAVLLKAAPARYPTAAMRARQEGWVMVSFTVDTDGRTSDVKVVEAQPRHVFERAAQDAVEKYRFTPAMKDGSPVASTKQQRIEFKL